MQGSARHPAAVPSADGEDIADFTERASIISIMTEAINKNLGQYTVEQEADELAVEWMSKLGLPLDAAIIAQIKLGEAYFNDLPNADVYGWVSGTACRKAHENKWVNDKGEPMMVPVAAWNDIHHSPCFRAFNMEREIKAHGYTRAGQEASGQGPSWEELVKSALPVAKPEPI